MQLNLILCYGLKICRSLPLLSLSLIVAISPIAVASEDHSHHQHMMAAEPALKISQDIYELPNIKLISNKGQATNINSLVNDETVIVNFIFTTCTAICPVQTASFAQLDKALEKEGIKARLISISIDPENDTPQQLERYARKFGASDNWLFLTGDKQDIVDVQKAFHAFRGNKMNHEPIAFIRKNVNTAWTRIEGFSSAADILKEYKKQ